MTGLGRLKYTVVGNSEVIIVKTNNLKFVSLPGSASVSSTFDVGEVSVTASAGTYTAKIKFGPWSEVHYETVQTGWMKNPDNRGSGRGRGATGGTPEMLPIYETVETITGTPASELERREFFIGLGPALKFDTGWTVSPMVLINSAGQFFYGIDVANGGFNLGLKNLPGNDVLFSIGWSHTW